jgi:thiol-disulfide isomerase/thioredoxin
MKYLFILLFSFVILQSCTSKKTEEEKAVVPILNFDELEPRLQKNNDTIYIVNFWATWCKPCVHELPDFERLAAEYKNEKVKFLLVSMDFPQHLETQVIPFIATHKLKSEVVLLFDPNANVWINKVSSEWTGSIPATVVYTKNSRSFHEGSYTYEELKSVIESQKL